MPGALRAFNLRSRISPRDLQDLTGTAVTALIGETAPGAAGYAPSPHTLTSAHHTGLLASTQATQFAYNEGNGADDASDRSAYNANRMTGAKATILPVTSMAYDIGSSVKPWGDGFMKSLTLHGADIADTTAFAVSADGYLSITPSGGRVNLDADLYFVGAQSISTTAGDLTVAAAAAVTLQPAAGSAVNVSLSGLGDFLVNTSQLVVDTSAAAVGINTTAPDKALEVNSATGACLRLTYNDADGSATNYADFSVSSGGNLVAAPTGDLILDPTGNNVFPATNYDLNLGSLSKKYLSLHAAELWVETLVAQNTLATIGGRILVGPTTVLIADLTDVATTIDVKHNQMASGDRVYMEANGAVEFMSIDSAATPIAGGYRYTVTRNLDLTGANAWSAGDAMFNTGTTGDGFIDLYSVTGVMGGAGPAIVGNVRNGATYNDWTEHWAIGNLNGLYGYGVDTYGVAFGKYSGANYVTIDATNGIRFFDADDAIQAQLSSTTWTLGQVAASKSNVYITAGALSLRNNTTERISLTAAGVLTVNDSAGAAVITLDASAGAEITKKLTMPGANSAIAIGSTPPTSATVGTGIWVDRTGMYGLAADVQQAIFNAATGAITAGAGNVLLNASGLSLLASTEWVESASVTWKSGATTLANQYVYNTAGTTFMFSDVASIAATVSANYVRANAPATYQASVQFQANSGATSGLLTVAADSNATPASWIIGDVVSTTLTGGLNVGTATGAGTGDVYGSGELQMAGTGTHYVMGNVGIGTTGPNVLLDLVGAHQTPNWGVVNVQTSDAYAIEVGGSIAFGGKYNAGGSVAQWARILGAKENSTDGNYAGYLSFWTRANGSNSIERLRIASDGTFTGSASNDISDARLKENVATVKSALARITQLRGVSFNWTAEAKMTDRPQFGVIAQEVEPIFPELVLNTSVFGDGYKSVQYGGFVAPFIEAIKELHQTDTDHEQEIRALKARISQLEARLAA